jgi:hypothetical protein
MAIRCTVPVTRTSYRLARTTPAFRRFGCSSVTSAGSVGIAS